MSALTKGQEAMMKSQKIRESLDKVGLTLSDLGLADEIQVHDVVIILRLESKLYAEDAIKNYYQQLVLKDNGLSFHVDIKVIEISESEDKPKSLK